MNSVIHVFKFGGASVKDAKAVLNIVDIIQKHDQFNLVIVVSAMGKTTNKLEDIFDSFIKKDKEAYLNRTNELKTFHLNIIQDLFKGDSLVEINEIINALFKQITSFFDKNERENRSYLYDQLIPFGEMLSTKIIQHCLEKSDVKSSWLDAKTCIKTDSNYQNANVDWALTEKDFFLYVCYLHSVF